MHILVNILFIFIFLFILFFFNLPDVNNNNYIMHKVVIFFSILIFQYTLILISKLKNKCKIDGYDIFYDSLQTALASFISYTIYTDYIYINRLAPYNNMGKLYHNALISLLISGFILIIKAICLLVNQNYMKCERYD